MFQSPGKATVAQLRTRAAELVPGMTTGRRIDHNTFEAVDAEGVRHVILHSTKILTLFPDGSFIVDTGGFNTHTTRARLNSFLPAGWGVHTERGDIYLTRWLSDGQHPAVPFERQVMVSADGKVTPDVSPAALLGTAKLIDRFIRHARSVGLPSAEDSKGDPWVFEPGQVTREVAQDWLESLYWTRRLYILALVKAGLNDVGISIHLGMADRAGGKLDKLDYGRVRRLLRAAMGKAS